MTILVGKRLSLFAGAVLVLVAVAVWLLWPAGRDERPASGLQQIRAPESRPVALDRVIAPPQPPSPAPTESAPATDAASKPLPVVPQLPGSVSGEVLDALGDPIPGAEVWIVASSRPGEPILRTSTDRAGRFQLEPLALADSLLVRARAKGHNVGQAYVALRVEAPRDTASIRLWDAGTIRGRVRDAGSAEPIAGASVWASYQHARVFGFEAQAEVLTGADGRFELPGVPLGVIVVRAVAPGHAMGEKSVPLTSDGDVDLDLVAGPGVELTVTVSGLDAAGVRQTDISVIAYASGYSQALASTLRRGTLDAEGKWSVQGLPDLEFLVMPYAPEGWSFQPREQRAKPGSAPHALAFKAVRDGEVLLKGSLRDDAGRPLPNETILTRAANGGRRATAKTASDGSFTIGSPLAQGEKCVFYLVDSKYVLNQAKDSKDFNSSDMRSRAWWETTVAPTVDLQLVAIPECRVLGHVFAATGVPVAGAKVVLEHADARRGPRWMAFAWTSTDAKGSYCFEGLHIVDDELRVGVADRLGAGFSRTFKLTAGRDAEDVDIALSASAVVEGTVRNQQGLPLPGARIWLMGRNEESRSQQSGNINEVLADRNGRYRFPGVGPGEFTLQAMLEDRRPDFREKPEPFRVEAGGRVERDVIGR